MIKLRVKGKPITELVIMGKPRGVDMHGDAVTEGEGEDAGFDIDDLEVADVDGLLEEVSH